MGEVYRARDTRLGRDVALKVLPSAFSSDPERVRRFEQEGRTAAALNHPNIIVLYDAGLQDGVYYVATEFLEGETLRQRLASAALPVRKTIDYGVQIARGLAAALNSIVRVLVTAGVIVFGAEPRLPPACWNCIVRLTSGQQRSGSAANNYFGSGYFLREWNDLWSRPLLISCRGCRHGPGRNTVY